MDMIQSLLRVSLLSSVLIGFVLLIRVLWHQKVRVSIIVGLWLVVVLRMLLPFTLHVSVNLFDLVPKHAVSVAEPEVMPETSMVVKNESSSITMDKSPVDNSTVESNEVVTTTKVDTTTPVMSVREMVDQIDWWMVASIAWLLGAIVVGMRFMVQHGQFRKRIEPSHGTQNSDLQRMVVKHREDLGIKREATVLTCAHVHVPVTYGWIKPKILLPVGFEDTMEDDKINLILLHECCHIKRMDILKSYIWMICTILYWFNPLVHIAYSAYLDDVEHACDAMVMKYICYEDTYTYSQSLLDVTKQVAMGQPLPLTVSLCKDTSKLRKRVMNMVAPKRKSKWIELIIVLMAVVMMAGCFTTACQPMDTSNKEVPIESESFEETTCDIQEGARLPELITLEEALKAVNAYRLSEDEKLQYITCTEYFGDEILCFANQEPVFNGYNILASDKSLVSIESKKNARIPFRISLDEAKSRATKLVAEHFGQYRYEISSCKEGSHSPFHIYYIKGHLWGMREGEGVYCSVELNGAGEMLGIYVAPPVDYSKGISKEEAYKMAIQGLIERYHIVDTSKLKTMEYELATDCNLPQHVFQFSYRTHIPSEIEYNYDATVYVDVAQRGQVITQAYLPDSQVPLINHINDLITVQYAVDEAFNVPQYYLGVAGKVKEPKLITVDNAIKAAESYMLSEDTSLRYLCYEPLFDDEMVYLEGDGGTLYQVLASDKTLLSLYRNKEEWDTELKLSDEDAKAQAMTYARQYYPIDQIDLERNGKEVYLFTGHWLKSGRCQTLTIMMDGTGELIYIGSLPPRNTYYAITQEEAEERALRYLKKYRIIKDEDLSVYNKRTVNHKAYCYAFDFVYRTKDFGAGEYNFDATVYVHMTSGNLYKMFVIQHPSE